MFELDQMKHNLGYLSSYLLATQNNKLSAVYSLFEMIKWKKLLLLPTVS